MTPQQALPSVSGLTARFVLNRRSGDQEIFWVLLVSCPPVYSGLGLGLMRTFGMSAPLAVLQQEFGFTTERVVAAARAQVAKVARLGQDGVNRPCV